jgi:acyl-coenzyme A thioesterase PaaI-like protein
MNGDYFGGSHRCYACGPRHPHGLHLDFVREDDAVVTRFVPTHDHESVPNVMHGGLVTTLADELGGWVLVLLCDKFGFTGSMTSRFLKPVRVGVELVGRGTLVRDTRRLVQVHVELSQRGEACFRSDLTFVLLDRQGCETMLDGPVPAEWERWFRR